MIYLSEIIEKLVLLMVCSLKNADKTLQSYIPFELKFFDFFIVANFVLVLS